MEDNLINMFDCCQQLVASFSQQHANAIICNVVLHLGNNGCRQQLFTVVGINVVKV